MNAVLKELSNSYNDENFIRNCKRHEKLSLEQKIEFIRKNAPLELLMVGWGLLENTKDNESDVWVKLNGENMQVLKRYYLIYQKEEKS